MEKRFKQSRSVRQKGYTLIELLVVIGLTVILLITATSIFFTTFIGGGKTASGEYAKQAGQNTLNQITYLVRNARKLTTNASGQVCSASMTSLGLIGLDGGTTILSTSQGRIASNSGVFLTPTDLTFPVPLVFSCSPSNYGTATWDGSPPRITVSFTVQKGTSGVDRDRDIIAIPFQSTITMRNF